MYLLYMYTICVRVFCPTFSQSFRVFACFFVSPQSSPRCTVQPELTRVENVGDDRQ